jgi:hypothetical protein
MDRFDDEDFRARGARRVDEGTTARRSSYRLPLRRFYSVAELARKLHIDRRRMRRTLEELGVEFFPVGRRMCVPRSELVAKLKPLLDTDEAFEELCDEDLSKTD